MEREDYRKLDVELPIEPTSNPKPWWVAGWLFVLLIAATMVYYYLKS